jgi:hypothetical protein
MKLIIFGITLFFSCLNISYSQLNIDSFSCTSGVFHTFYLNGKEIKKSEAINKLRSQPESSIYLNKYKTQSNYGGVLLTIGGICIGTIFTELIKSKSNDNYSSQIPPNSGLFILSLGVSSTIASVYLLNAQNKNLKKSIEIYNKTNQELGNKQSVTMNYGLLGNGIGVQLNF